ncbi:MAG TPA: hypothetical protein VK430_12950 [Xanthobacteraceae bacterium]|nr:hypothetical protein [Xanthobacteraceae bacterium]
MRGDVAAPPCPRRAAADSSIMVNGPLLERPAGARRTRWHLRKRVGPKHPSLTITAQEALPHAFAQILGKLYFFDLRENLRRILLDYGQKRPRPANVAFNAAC